MVEQVQSVRDSHKRNGASGSNDGVQARLSRQLSALLRSCGVHGVTEETLLSVRHAL